MRFVLEEGSAMSPKRRYAELLLVALAASIVTMVTPAIGHGVRHALFAHNADHLDSKDSVSATTTATRRRNKIPSYSTSGFLPNNALKKAIDANKLDGADSSA